MSEFLLIYTFVQNLFANSNKFSLFTYLLFKSSKTKQSAIFF